MSKQWSVKTWVGWSIAALFALIIAEGGLALISSPQQIAAHPTIAHHMLEHPLGVYLHFIFGPIALAVGIFQMLPAVRAHHRLHRWLGRGYVLSCLASALGGVWLALFASSGPIATAGFGLLGVCWFATTSKAWWCAREKDFIAHRTWMIRSYALTFAAVSLRLQLTTIVVAGWDFALLYPFVAFSCWVPNVALAETWLRRE